MVEHIITEANNCSTVLRPGKVPQLHFNSDPNLQHTLADCLLNFKQVQGISFCLPASMMCFQSGHCHSFMASNLTFNSSAHHYHSLIDT